MRLLVQHADLREYGRKSTFRTASSAANVISEKQVREKRRDRASQDLLFACLSFLVLLVAAVADAAFRIS